MFGRMFLSWFISIFLYAITLFIVAHLFDQIFIKDFQTALLASVILSILNVFVRPILIIFTLPITILSFGFFLLIINTFTLLIASTVMGESFIIGGFFTAFIASIIISILNTLLHRMIGDLKRVV